MGTVNAPMARRFGVALLATATLALLGATQAWAAPTATGMLPDGGSWIADVPADWNGTLLLYSHGYGTLSPADAPDPATHDALLADGYALAGSSYDPSGSLWALGSAVRDQFETLAAVKKTVLPHRPAQVLAFGTSMGGLISALEDQQSNGRLDGALTTCGLVAGGIQLNNYQLDGEYAIAKLLASTQSIKLVHFSSQADGAATATELNAAAATAQGSSAGRARLALAMSLMNVGAWAPGATMPGVYDYAEQERQQYAMEFTANPVLLFVETGRQQIEQAAGGNGGWDVGVDFTQLLRQSSYRAEVQALYREAGISLEQDLRTLTRGANIRADTKAIRWLQQTSVPTGRLQVPELDLHTISDQLVPVGELLRTSRPAGRRPVAAAPGIRRSTGALQFHFGRARRGRARAPKAAGDRAVGFGRGSRPAPGERDAAESRGWRSVRPVLARATVGRQRAVQPVHRQHARLAVTR